MFSARHSRRHNPAQPPANPAQMPAQIWQARRTPQGRIQESLVPLEEPYSGTVLGNQVGKSDWKLSWGMTRTGVGESRGASHRASPLPFMLKRRSAETLERGEMLKP